MYYRTVLKKPYKSIKFTLALFIIYRNLSI
nr:MAG TPA: hypothetical protein [Caudoviricetes sp.]